MHGVGSLCASVIREEYRIVGGGRCTNQGEETVASRPTGSGLRVARHQRFSRDEDPAPAGRGCHGERGGAASGRGIRGGGARFSRVHFFWMNLFVV